MPEQLTRHPDVTLQVLRSAAQGVICIAVLAGCAGDGILRPANQTSPSRARALIATLLPPATTDRAGWATDIYAGFAALNIPATPTNVCSVIAVTEQESGLRTDPPVPNLAAITWEEIDRRSERLRVPKRVVRAALLMTSPGGRTYAERIDGAKTEKELSEIFEDFIDMVPMGTTFFAGWNPVRTGGPMQVSIEFAQAHTEQKTYPYPLTDSLRHEVFTRRGGMYFGIAHLLDYPAAYDKPIYRFADFNAGRYASRNAALQHAISVASGIPLMLDGDLVVPGGASKGPGSTERAARVLADRLGLNETQIRRALEQGDSASLERTSLYQRVFALADKLEGRPMPRAVVPRIALQSPKIRRKLTTDWFAQRVDERWNRCMARAG